MVDWHQEIENLDLGNLTDFFRSGDYPVMGSGLASGFYLGKPFLLSCSSVCSMLQWIVENTDFAVELEYRFTASTSYYTLYIYDKNNLDENNQRILLKSYGPYSVTGRDVDNGDQIMIHGLLGFKLFKIIGEWAEAKIAADQ